MHAYPFPDVSILIFTFHFYWHLLHYCYMCWQPDSAKRVKKDACATLWTGLKEILVKIHLDLDLAASYYEHNMLVKIAKCWATSKSKQEYFQMVIKNMLVMSKRQIRLAFVEIRLVNHASGQLIPLLWL